MSVMYLSCMVTHACCVRAACVCVCAACVLRVCCVLRAHGACVRAACVRAPACCVCVVPMDEKVQVIMDERLMEKKGGRRKKREGEGGPCALERSKNDSLENRPNSCD